MIITNSTLLSSTYGQFTAGKTDKKMSLDPVRSFMADATNGVAAEFKTSDVVRADVHNLLDSATEIQDEISFAQITDKAIDSLTEIMQKMNVLAVKAISGDLNSAERESLQSEMMELKVLLREVQNNTDTAEESIFANGRSSYGIAGRIARIDVNSIDVSTESDAVNAAADTENYIDALAVVKSENETNIVELRDALIKHANGVYEAEAEMEEQKTISSLVANVFNQASQALQAQANQTNGGVLSVLFQ